jgi:hypothetical protein
MRPAAARHAACARAWAGRLGAATQHGAHRAGTPARAAARSRHPKPVQLIGDRLQGGALRLEPADLGDGGRGRPARGAEFDSCARACASVSRERAESSCRSQAATEANWFATRFPSEVERSSPRSSATRFQPSRFARASSWAASLRLRARRSSRATTSARASPAPQAASARARAGRPASPRVRGVRIHGAERRLIRAAQSAQLLCAGLCAIRGWCSRDGRRTMGVPARRMGQ